jgi:hypothetical protein
MPSRAQWFTETAAIFVMRHVEIVSHALDLSSVGHSPLLELTGRRITG